MNSRNLILCLAVILSLTTQNLVSQEPKGSAPKAAYYLVGLGPGDPDLITVRALNTIAKADVIFCNPRHAQNFKVQLSDKTVHLNRWGRVPFYGLTIDRVSPQDREEFVRITKLRDEFIVKVREYAKAGKNIVVLDGGDPMIYGPYTWTLEEFKDLNPVVVPGLSSFNAANAALKKSVTNSRSTKSVTLTATDKFGRTDSIEKLAAVQNSMVLFTMRDEFDSFIKSLKKSYSPETPLAIVRHAGYKDQEKIIVTTLAKALDEVKSDELSFEYLIYVGEFLNFKYSQNAETVNP